ncbi:MAG: hypothetical protein M3Q56_07120 [Bacteroidota bacterium]|nr:hypothetical protein [Bacteroidota bacterium]
MKIFVFSFLTIFICVISGYFAAWWALLPLMAILIYFFRLKLWMALSIVFLGCFTVHLIYSYAMELNYPSGVYQQIGEIFQGIHPNLLKYISSLIAAITGILGVILGHSFYRLTNPNNK